MAEKYITTSKQRRPSSRKKSLSNVDKEQRQKDYNESKKKKRLTKKIFDIKKLKQRIVHEDGGFTIVNPDKTYTVHDKNGRQIESGSGYGKSRRHKKKGGKIKTYSKGGGVRKPKY